MLTFQIYLPVTYALNTFGLCFATLSSLFVWLFLEKRHSIVSIAKASSFGRYWRSGVTERRGPQPQYRTAPTWWYWVSAAVAVALGIFACEFYPVQLRWHGALFSFAISAIFFLPVRVATP